MISSIQQSATQASASVSCGIKYLASALCGKKEIRRNELHIASGMRRPGTKSDLKLFEKIISSDELSSSNVKRSLDNLSNNKLTLSRDVIYIPGYLDPALDLIGTDLGKNIYKYIENPLAIRIFPFASAPFRKLTIERCALKMIKQLNNIYDSSILDEIDLDIIGHSMGARIAEVMIQLIVKFPELTTKKFVFHKLLSVSGANKGAPMAFLSKYVCHRENVGNDLIPENIENYDEVMVEIDVESIYVVASNDNIVPPDYAAPRGHPVIMLNNVATISPHTAILSDPVFLYLLLKTLGAPKND